VTKAATKNARRDSLATSRRVSRAARRVVEIFESTPKGIHYGFPTEMYPAMRKLKNSLDDSRPGRSKQPRSIILCAKGVRDTGEVQAILSALAGDLVAGRISPKIVNKVNNTIGRLLRAIEQNDRKKIRESRDELKELGRTFQEVKR
jgi:hypothetical protein